MDRLEFMRQLECLLQDISPTEREEAIQYYNDYFDDAGAENERDVIEALGNPARVAENIKRGLAGKSYRDEDIQVNHVKDQLIKYQEEKIPDPKAVYANEEPRTNTTENTGMPTWLIITLIVAGVFFSPVILGLAFSASSIVLSLIIGWFSIILAFGAVALVLLLLLFVLFATGIICIPGSPVIGVSLIASALICGALGILFMMLTVAMAGTVTPAVFGGCAKLIRNLRTKDNKEAMA